MVSARVERTDFDKFEQIYSQQPWFYLQDFIGEVFRMYISGAITVEHGKFQIKPIEQPNNSK